MAERFKTLFRSPSNLVCENAEVIIEEGALLLDNETGDVLAQLKLKNVSSKIVKAITVGITALDTAGREINGVDSFTYLDLNVVAGASFGSKTPVFLDDKNTRKIEPYVKEVIFTDNTIWTCREKKWRLMPERVTLVSWVGHDIAQEYRSQIGKNAVEYVPDEMFGFFRCPCGEDTRQDVCPRCGTSKEKAFEIYNKDNLKKSFDEKESKRKAKEEADRLEAERIAEELRIAAKKRKKAFAIGTPIVAACIAFVIVLTTVIIQNSRYNAAVSLLNDGKIIDAYESLIALKGYKDSATKASKIFGQYKIEKWKIAKVGDIVYFGAYEQDNNISNGKEDVEWIVLAKENEKALVISKYALDCQKYNYTHTYVTWEKCSLRTWLNGTFLNNAFSADEQAKIATTNVSADKNPNYSTNPGNSTNDKVFLLSITEEEKYFTTDESRKCAPTAYAKAQGAYTNNNKTASGEATCWWWLRSPGVSQYDAAYVHIGGSVDDGGDGANSVSGCVRPAMWISLDN